MVGNPGQTARGAPDSLMSVILGIDQSAASRCRSELHAGTTQLRTRLGRGGIGNGARNARAVPPLKVGQQPRAGRRSEEHTSELQSLMRISYAGFCFKKKNQSIQQSTTIIHQNYT